MSQEQEATRHKAIRKPTYQSALFFGVKINHHIPTKYQIQPPQPLPVDLEASLGTISGLSFSPDGHLLAIGILYGADNQKKGPDLVVRNASTGQVVDRVSVDLGTSGNPSGELGVIGALDVAFSPDGRYIAMALSDGSIRLVDVASNRIVASLEGLDTGAQRVAFSRDGHILAGASRTGQIIVWRLTS
jgi:WD40 repeat protein